MEPPKQKPKVYCEQYRTSDGTMITMEEFGKMPDGSKVYKVNVTNRLKNTMELISYGATLKSLHIAGRDKKLVNVVVGYDTFEEYLRAEHPVGAVMGRIAGRVSKGQIFLGKKIVQLGKNSVEDHLHGGQDGFQNKNFDVTIRGTRVYFTYNSENKTDGYPGSLRCNVSYQLNNWNEVVIDYEATSDEPTPVNLSSFIGWNLSGNHDSGLGEHKLQVITDYYLPTKPDGSPTGEISFVNDSALDLNDLSTYYERVKTAKMEGFDLATVYLCHRVKNKSKFDRHTIATLISPSTGLKMDLETSHPGLYLTESNISSSDANEADKQTGLVLMTSGFPDATKYQPQFPTIILPRGEVYYQANVYKFSVEEKNDG